MAPLVVLVHSPLVGPTTWEAVAEHLAALGYEVRVPDLTGTVAAVQRPPYCPRQASVIAASAGSQPALFVGHSGAGPLLAAAGERRTRVHLRRRRAPHAGPGLDGHRAAGAGPPG